MSYPLQNVLIQFAKYIYYHVTEGVIYNIIFIYLDIYLFTCNTNYPSYNRQPKDQIFFTFISFLAHKSQGFFKIKHFLVDFSIHCWLRKQNVVHKVVSSNWLDSDIIGVVKQKIHCVSATQSCKRILRAASYILWPSFKNNNFVSLSLIEIRFFFVNA